MKIYNVNDPEFISYGRIIEGFKENKEFILDILKTTELPSATKYVADDSAFCGPLTEELGKHLYGGMPFQMGWCNGHNTKLNCLEYHRDSEFNLSPEDFILLLAKQDEIVDGKLDTSKVKAFFVPKGVLVEVYATTLHYAPCHADQSKGFHVLVILPKGTNTQKPVIKVKGGDDDKLRACNKWLLSHPDSNEAKDGAYVGLVGENIDLAK